MKYTLAFFIKLGVTLGLLLVVLGLFFGASFIDIIIISALLTAVAYLGDIFILPRIGNMFAAAGDLILAFFVIYLLGLSLFDPGINVFSAAFLSSLFIAGGELYYHRYLGDHVFKTEAKPHYYPRTRMTQTEFAEEFETDFKKNEDKG